MKALSILLVLLIVTTAGAQVVPPVNPPVTPPVVPPVAPTMTWGQLLTFLTPVLLTLLACLKNYLDTRAAKAASLASLASARSSEAHSRQTCHNTRDVPTIRSDLSHLMTAMPEALKPQERLVVTPERGHMP